MAEKLKIPAGTFLVEVALNNGVTHKGLLTGGLHGRFLRDLSQLRLLRDDNTTAPPDFAAHDIETVTLGPNGDYDQKSLIGMTPYQVRLKSSRAMVINCFRIKKSDPWIIGLQEGGQVLQKVFVNFEAVSQIKKIARGEKAPAPEPPRAPARGATDSASGPKPEITRFVRGTAPSLQDERFRPMLEHIKKHEVVDYKILSVFLNIDPASMRRKIRLGDFLTQEELITEEQLEEALAFQKNSPRMRLGEILLELGYLNEFVLAVALAVQFRLPFTILDPKKIDKGASELFNGDLAREYGAIPVKLLNNKVLLAVADPGLIDVQELSFLINRHISLIVTRQQDLEAAIVKIYGSGNDLSQITGESQELYLDEQGAEDESVDTIVARGKEAPIIALANQIIIDAIDRKASDIHIIPEKKFIKVSYRVNGTIHEKSRLNKNLLNYLVARFKVLAGMNIVERRLPQDGRIHGRAQDQTIDIRVSALPAQHGETLVLRLRYPDKQLPDLAELGFAQEHLNSIRQAISRTKGLILVTGPTGSGKSTTLISFLKAVRDLPEKRHIITAEDPVELVVPGLTQIPVNTAIGMTFPRILRNILRHDPDVIMVGEIRDQETAKIAVQAAMTGHLVFSTLHTNDAISTLARLEDLEVEPFLVATATDLVLAQRLVKTLCTCSEPHEPDDQEKTFLAAMDIEIPDQSSLRRPRGCEKCEQSGFAGRAMTYELLEMDRDLRAMDLKQATQSGELEKMLQGRGFVGLIRHGLDMVLRGETPLAEIMRHWHG